MMGGSATMGGFGSEGGMGMSQGMGATPTKQGPARHCLLKRLRRVDPATLAMLPGSAWLRSRLTQGYDELTLTPATIRQYQTATISDVEGRVLLDGTELKDIKLVGRVVEADPSDSALSLQIEDGTGRVRIKYWYPQAADGTTDGARKADMDASVTEGTFVSVSAAVKTSNGRMILNGSTIKPLADPNEITLHFVEAIHVHVDRTRRIP
ncbi:RPA2A, partial [Symbiodinium sp. KB8]